MREDLVNLTKSLVQFQTVRGREKQFKDCLAFIEDYFENLEIERFEREGKTSLLISKEKTLEPDILLHGHIDVVEAEKQLFEPEIEEGKLYGRGTADMKAGVACLMKIIDRIGDKADVSLLLTSDEEVGGFDGTGYMIEKGLRPNFVISAEPDDSGNFPSIVTKQKGVLQLRVRAEGKSAHGSKPQKGENAAEKLMEKYREIRRLFDHSQSFGSTINLGKVSSGKSVNQVPEKAEMELDIRYTDQFEKEELLRDLENIEAIDFEITAEAPMMKTDQKDVYVQRLADCSEKAIGETSIRSENFASDMRFFAERGIPAICFGPDGFNLHGNKEYVELENLENYVEVLERFITSPEIKLDKR